ncbi:MAG: fibrobacter succinogenes major paralogous domain-containing protein [Candidatus Cloacimonetes bacterium]|nr:fibrobacter succinogenes major paralogous domain-containing protein [Candidatus Cloacimonadota bacterium]MBS3768562.1 fibrobacter succinogenes major paralogous domain-containing protein [Candidatus Cloacimonadota bacterium]
MRKNLIVFTFFLIAILQANTLSAVSYITNLQREDNSFGESVTQLSSPQDVVIEVSGDDVILSWSPVTTDINGDSINASYCYYNIYFADTPDIDINNTDNFVSRTTLTDFTHESAITSTNLFYTITATRYGTVTDIDCNEYGTIIIGDQEWMAENLKVTHYRNGDAIPNVTNNSTWAGLSSGAYCYYNNNSANGDTYGALYNWFAVNDSRGLAPEGWHVPTDDEIKQLEMYLGLSQSQANNTSWRGTNEGSKLAGGYELWHNGSLRDNPEFDTSGFSFFPGGYRYYNDGSFNYSMTYYGYLWASTEYNSLNGWYRLLYSNNTKVYRHFYFKQNGFSVRCVKSSGSK